MSALRRSDNENMLSTMNLIHMSILTDLKIHIKVDMEIFTQADRAQSSRVPVPLPEYPYKGIRQAYLDGTDTESEPFEDPVETETPESPITVAPPTSLPKSTPPTLVLILCRTACMAVRVPPTMSPGLSSCMEEVAAMSDFAFLEDDEEEDEEIEKTLDSDYVGEDVEDEGPATEDEDPVIGDEGLAKRDEGPGMGVESRHSDVESRGSDDESHGLDDEGHSIESDGLGLGEEEEVVLEGQQRAVSVIGTAVSTSLGLGYEALRRQELALEEDQVYSTFEVGHGSGSALESERPKRVSASRQSTLTMWTYPKDGMVYIDVLAYPPPAPPVQTPPSPEWSFGSLPISPSPYVVPSPISSPMIPLTIPYPVATLVTTETEGFLTELGALVEMQGGLIRDHAVRMEELSPALFERYDKDIGELFTRSGAVRDEIFSQSVSPGVMSRSDRCTKSDSVLERAVFPVCKCVALVARDRADTYFLIRIGVRCS
ncbi:hypothetical protein Tco_0805283 [Tanacetum coccineum]